MSAPSDSLPLTGALPVSPPAQDAPDDALVRAAREGNVRAFETLLSRHEARVLRTLRLLGVPPQDREDVAQDVFLRVFRHLGSFRTDRPFAAWLYRITVNASHDHRMRQGHAGRGTWGSEVADLASAEASPERSAEDLDLRRRLELALDHLSERERAVFVLRELEGLETGEIARAIGITSITVRRHLGRARERLRTLLT